MEVLHIAYENALRQVAEQIQNSELLKTYLEEEDETLYKSLCDEFEPQIGAIYDQVAHENPLMLESLETLLLENEFEGLFLPKILGFSVLRPHIDKNIKYQTPQNHFKNILLAICNSPNFEQIKKRIGQTTQIGFALSSDIWITNLIDSIDNKKVKTYLLGLKSESLRDLTKRAEALKKYSNQFSQVNFHSANFPTNQVQLISNYENLKDFLLHRSKPNLDNESLIPHFYALINNKELSGREFLDLMIIIGLKFPLEGEVAAAYTKRMKDILESDDQEVKSFFNLYDDMLNQDVVSPENELSIIKLLNTVNSNELQNYFSTVSEVHNKGFVHRDAIEAVRAYYDAHEGLSQENECVRTIVMHYITRLINNLEVEAYHDFFDIYKTINEYISIFSNEKFNQEIKEASLNYTSKCFKTYTDKRGKEYQEIKKFISSTFVDLKFLSEKQVTEMFKTKRKPSA